MLLILAIIFGLLALAAGAIGLLGFFGIIGITVVARRLIGIAFTVLLVLFFVFLIMAIF